MEIKVTWPGFVCQFIMAKPVLLNNYFVNELFLSVIGSTKHVSQISAN